MPTEIATKSLFFSWKLMKFLNVWSTSLVSENWIKCMHSRIQCKQKSPIRVYFFFLETQEVLNVRSTSLVSENWIKFMHSWSQCKQKSPIRVYFFFLETQEVFKRAINLFGPYWEKGEVEFL